MSNKIRLHKLVFSMLKYHFKEEDRSYIEKNLEKKYISTCQDSNESLTISFYENIDADYCLQVITLLQRTEKQQRGPAVPEEVELYFSLSGEPESRTSEEEIKTRICRIIGYKEEEEKVEVVRKEDGLIEIEIDLPDFTSVMETFKKIQQEWNKPIGQGRFLGGIEEAQRAQRAKQRQWEEDGEKFSIPQRLFDRIKPKTIKSLLKQGCSVEPAMHKRCTILVLNGMDPRKDNQLRKKIFTLLTSLVKGKEQSRQSHRVALHLPIPKGKAGYVVGTKGAVLDEIKTSYGVSAFMIKKTDESSSINYSKLILSSKSIQGLVHARKKVQKLLDTADNAGDMLKVGDHMYEEISIPAAIYQKELARFEEIYKRHKGCITPKDMEGPTKRLTISAGAVSQVRKIRKEFLDVKNIPDYSIKKELSIKTPIWIMMIGKHGKTIKYLQKKLNVSLIFEGKNDDPYPKERTLLIRGQSEEDVEKALQELDKCKLGLEKSLERIVKKKSLERYFVEWAKQQVSLPHYEPPSEIGL